MAYWRFARFLSCFLIGSLSADIHPSHIKSSFSGVVSFKQLPMDGGRVRWGGDGGEGATCGIPDECIHILFSRLSFRRVRSDVAWGGIFTDFGDMWDTWGLSYSRRPSFCQLRCYMPRGVNLSLFREIRNTLIKEGFLCSETPNMCWSNSVWASECFKGGNVMSVIQIVHSCFFFNFQRYDIISIPLAFSTGSAVWFSNFEVHETFGVLVGWIFMSASASAFNFWVVCLIHDVCPKAVGLRGFRDRREHEVLYCAGFIKPRARYFRKVWIIYRTSAFFIRTLI